MYYSLKSDCYFRSYKDIGYITRPIIAIEEIVDNIGALFIGALNYEPQEIDSIVHKLLNHFDDVGVSDLRNDVTDFFNRLAKDGFLNCADNLSDFKNTGFDYSTLKGKLAPKTFATQLEESSSQFLEDYFKYDPRLTSFHIELTSKCNERCIHCYIPHEKKDTDIDRELMLSVLKQCKEMGVITVIFSGGEPMLHPEFCEFLHYAKDLDLNVTVLSNLTLLSAQILEELKYKHASCVNVSLYSMEPKVHDQITGVQGSFKKTKNNILTLIENNIPVQVNCPIMKQNKDSFYEVIKWGQEHKCAVITDYLIMARYDGSTDNLDNRLSGEELHDVIENLVKHDAILQSNIQRKNKDESANRIKADDRICGVGMTTLCMVAKGNVYPCAGWQKMICGNIKETPLKEIWEKSPQVDYLRRLRQKDFEECLNCKENEYCLMCMGRNSNEAPDGDIFTIPKITCEAAKIHHSVIDKYLSQN